jgi:hypothetical protein
MDHFSTEAASDSCEKSKVIGKTGHIQNQQPIPVVMRDRPVARKMISALNLKPSIRSSFQSAIRQGLS